MQAENHSSQLAIGADTVVAVVGKATEPVVKDVEVMVNDHGEPETEYVEGTTSAVRTLGRTRFVPFIVPLNEIVGLSASITGVKISSRIRRSFLSAMYIRPEATDTPDGPLSAADPGAPVSPQAAVALPHAVPVPASV
jgi:hypothetical protein